MEVNTYRIDRSYAWNYENGPSWRGRFPPLAAGPMKEIFGLPVRSRIGVSAGILLNSRWIECYGRLGFDILTYKTVRSAFRPSYPLPNWVYVDASTGAGEARAVLRVAARRPRRARDVTSAVTFGMPSMAPEVWRRDVRKARRALGRGQMLIVSVVGTPDPAAGERAGREALVEDFARCARWAAEAGAHAVEANFSCPNVSSIEGSIYQDPAFSRELSGRLRDVLRSTPLLIKAGQFDSAERLGAFERAVEAHVDGVVVVNGISRRVVRSDGRLAFPGHEKVAVIGRLLQAPALEAVRAASRHARGKRSSPAVLAVGGIVEEEDAARFFEAGASAVLAGGGAALDPLLAARLKRAHPEW